jgi:hypothetical protein
LGWSIGNLFTISIPGPDRTFKYSLWKVTGDLLVINLPTSIHHYYCTWPLTTPKWRMLFDWVITKHGLFFKKFINEE